MLVAAVTCNFYCESEQTLFHCRIHEDLQTSCHLPYKLQEITARSMWRDAVCISAAEEGGAVEAVAAAGDNCLIMPFLFQ